MALRRPNPEGAGALRTISASRPAPDAQTHLLPVRDIELLRKPPARRYRHSRSEALTYATVRRARGPARPSPSSNPSDRAILSRNDNGDLFASFSVRPLRGR